MWCDAIIQAQSGGEGLIPSHKRDRRTGIPAAARAPGPPATRSLEWRATPEAPFFAEVRTAALLRLVKAPREAKLPALAYEPDVQER